MSLYDVAWVTHAEKQFNSLSMPIRSVMDKVALLQRDPKRFGIYDERADNYTTDFDFGFIVYAVLETRLKIIMLRISAVEP